MKMKVSLVLAMMTLAGCQSTDSQVRCDSSTNWQEIGLKTAQKGKNVRTFERYKSSCGAALPENAKDLYLEGYTLGIKEYCSYENGFAVAEKGIDNPNVCPFEIRAEFDKGYKIGALEQREKKENADYAERELARRQLQNRSGMSSTGQ